MQVLCLYGKRKSTPRVKGELRKQPYTVTLFDCNHFHGTRNSSLANAKIYVLLYSFYFALFFLFFEDNFQVQAPRDLYLEGRFKAGFYCVTRLGRLHIEGLIFGILR